MKRTRSVLSVDLREQKRNNHFYFDFETYNRGNQDDPKNPTNEAYVYGAGLLADGVLYTYFGLDALDRWWEKLKEIGAKRKLTLIAHNCGYDFAFILRHIYENNCNIKKVNAAQTDDDRTWLWANIIVDGLNIRFKDTWIWDKSHSLAKYSNIFKLKDVKKGTLEDYEKWNMYEENGKLYYWDKDKNLKQLDLEAETNYLENDLLLLPKVEQEIKKTKDLISTASFVPEKRKWIYGEDRLDNTITKASFSKMILEICAEEQFCEGFKLPITPENYYIQDGSYIGGFTAGNKNITELDLNSPAIKSYDVNSLYPSIMAELLPYGPTSYTKPKKGPYCEWYECRGTYCKYKEKFDFLDCHIISNGFEAFLDMNREAQLNGVPIQPIDTGVFLLLKEYYELILQYCDTDLKPVAVQYQALTDKLSEVFIGGYHQRQLANAKGDKARADSIKLILNSGYGKFGEKTHTRIMQWNHKEKQWEKIMANGSNQYSSLLTGLYICTKGRIKLMTAIKTEIENGNTFLYCDTDSIKLIENTPVKLEIHKDKLGAWKDEGEFNVWRYPLKRKRYYSYNTFTGDEKFACGGFDKEIIKSLDYHSKIAFFTANTNTLIKKGKKAKDMGDYYDFRKDKKVINNRYGIPRLFKIDITTENKFMKIHKVIEERERGRWVMSDYEGK